MSVVLFYSAVGCGGSQQPETERYGVSTTVPLVSPVRLKLTLPNGQGMAVESLRGKRVLLFLFTTYDSASQLSIDPLCKMEKQHPEIYIIGIALQTNPEKLLTLFADYFHVPFPLTYDADDRIRPGISDLGQIRVVPSLMLLDEKGYLVSHQAGIVTKSMLDELIGTP